MQENDPTFFTQSNVSPYNTHLIFQEQPSHNPPEQAKEPKLSPEQELALIKSALDQRARDRETATFEIDA